MFGSDILDIAIGLVFIYLLLSLICSVVNEWIAALFSLRARTLEDGIRNLLSKPEDTPNAESLTNQLYQHPLIAGLFKRDWLDRGLNRTGKPAYIPSRTFALALLDIIAPAELNNSQSIDDVRQAIDNLPDSRAKKALFALVDDAQNDLQKFRQNVENWYNDAMDRVSGWYKRKTQVIILLLALIIASVSNADTIAIVTGLMRDPALRASAVAAAEQYVKTNAAAPLDSINQVEAKLEPLHVPLGWVRHSEQGEEVWDLPSKENRTWFWLVKIFGLLLTGVALSLGAPFWFDVLNKFIVIRSTVKPREKSLDENSKDNAAAPSVQPMQNLIDAGRAIPLSLAGAALPSVQLSPASAASTERLIALPPALAPALAGEAARRGSQLLDIARPHIGEEYNLGALVPMNNLNWSGPWDCAEFVSWCVYQLIGKLYGCKDDNDDPSRTDAYTGWWGRDAGTVVRRVTVKQAVNTPGAILLRLPQPHMNGHIVLSDGQGGTIEAADHKHGVIAGAVADRRWDMGILIPEISYELGAGDLTVNPTIIYKLTSPYMKSREILHVQEQLKASGIDPGDVDGEYGPQTAAAVYSFQVREGLIADGEVGRQTEEALNLKAPIAAVQNHFPGLDMGSYPGDQVMEAIFNDPYVFTGYYLDSPCHRDKPAGHWEPWTGHWKRLREIGWGLAIVYVGQQMSGASPCNKNTLSNSQGQTDASDAVTKATSDALQSGVTIFLDVEAMDQIPAAMLDYVGGWVGYVLDNGFYKPGIYCHHKNADDLFAAVNQEYAKRNLSNEKPAFWVVNIKNNFDVVNDSPADSGVPYASIWQGRIGVANETHAQVTIKSLDQNVATTGNPSNA